MQVHRQPAWCADASCGSMASARLAASMPRANAERSPYAASQVGPVGDLAVGLGKLRVQGDGLTQRIDRVLHPLLSRLACWGSRPDEEFVRRHR